MTFFKVLRKFKIAAIDELIFFLWVEKLKVIIHIVKSHYPPSGNVILLKFKMATTNRLFKYL